MYRCPKCHVELPADARFCKSCGFNQTNARIASMSPPVQGVQRQVPPQQTQQGTQQPPTGTIQPQYKHVPQQPAAQPQPHANIPSPQQNFPGAAPFVPQVPVRTSTPLNAPRPQESIVQQRNNGSQQLMQVPMTPPLPTPQQGNIASQGFQQNMHLSRPAVPVTPQGPSNWVQQLPVTPQGQVRERPNQGAGYTPEQIMHTSTPPNQQYSPVKAAFEPLQWGLGALPDTPVNVESLEATSKAAQHWRQSWLDRQHDEAGPATGVSRGQALVPEPLLVMQHSFARMRAIILPKNRDDGKNSRLKSWLPAALLVCLIGVLGIYVFSTYSSGLGGIAAASLNTNADPTLSMKTTKTTMSAAKTISVAAGQAIQVHGEHFGADDTIIFFLGETQLKGTNGKPTSAQSNDQGIFDASLPIPSAQLAGEYVVQAQDNHTGQHAFLDIQTTTSAITNVLKFSTHSLAFASIVGRNPHEQIVSITNTSNTAIQWSAIAISDNQAGWLLLTNGKTSGQLEAGQMDKIHVSVITQGLISSLPRQPYTGKIVFTVVDQGQVILPVKLALSSIDV